MDFPDNAITNVHRIGHIDSLRWTVYSLVETTTADSLNQLYDIENELRMIGNHVLPDISRFEIWLFSLFELEAQTEMGVLELQQMTQRVISSRLTKVSSGALSSIEIRKESNNAILYTQPGKLAGGVLATTSVRGKTNSQAFGELSSSIPGSDAKEPKSLETTPAVSKPQVISDSLIFTKFRRAISMSFIGCLTKTRTWVPLGGLYCVRNVRPRALMPQEKEYWPAFPPSEIQVMSIFVEWTPSAEVVISSTYSTLPGLRRLSEVLLDQRRDEESFQSSKILVSPSGLIASYCGLADASGDVDSEASPGQSFQHKGVSEHSLSERKELVASGLAQRGIPLFGNEDWVRLQYRGTYLIQGILDDDRGSSELSGTFLWPASLCFCIPETFPHKGGWNQHLARGQGYSMDPLLNAETWYMGKSDRTAAIEAIRKQEEAEALKSKVAVNQSAGEEFRDLFPHPAQYGSTQDITSIYPTPPDGLPSQTMSSMRRATQVSYGDIIGKEHIDHVEESHLVGSPLALNLAPVISSTTYDQHEDDLYAEVENDMFAANGLTEADLDFFDEPRVDINFALVEDLAKDTAEVSSKKAEVLASLSNLGSLKELDFEDAVNATTMCTRTDNGKGILETAADHQDDSLAGEFSATQDLLPHDPEVSIVQCLPSLIQEEPSTRDELSSNLKSADQGMKDQRKVSFRPIPFKEKLDEFDQKYSQGRFGHGLGDTLENSRVRNTTDGRERRIPRVGLPSFSDQDSETTEGESTTDASDAEDDYMIQEVMNDEVRPLSSLKRKRGQEDSVLSQLDTPQCSHISGAENTPESLSDPATCMFSMEINSVLPESLASSLQNLKPETPKYHGSNREFMQVAQSVIEQLSLGTDSLSDIARSLETPYCQPSGGEFNAIEDPLRLIILQFFPHTEHWNLHRLANIGRDSEAAVADNLPSRPSQKESVLTPRTPNSPNPPTGTFLLPTPYARIRRNQKPIDILGSALHFWEELGLEPAHGAKNISALYIYPAIYSISEGLEVFATMIGSSYQNCKLGTHISISDLVGYPKGLVPVLSNNGSVAELSVQLNSLCEKLGQDLALLKAQEGNTVIYMINLFGSQNFVPHLCAAYLRLFKTYAASIELNKLDNPNDIVLQIIPGDLVASSDAITLPSPEAYRKLALEVHNRCGPDLRLDREESVRFSSAPSIQLARPIPKSISLKLSPEPSVSFLQADMFFHVAYSWVPGQQWLTASWTDNQGELQWNAPYCVGAVGEEDPWRAISAIFTEIWETTLELFQHPDSAWRLFIVKDSPMRIKELEAWQLLSAQPGHRLISTSVITVEAHPPLYFHTLGSIERFPLPNSNLYKSAESTPAGQTISPDPSGLASTPGGLPNPMTPVSVIAEPDQDAKLIDVTDESWGVVLPYPFPNTHLPSHCCRSAARGYLLKRAGTRDEDGLLPLAVDIVHTPKANDVMLKELIGMYRDLAALARLRGTVHGLHGILPWHIATAAKSNEGMNEMMSWDWG